VTDVPLKPPPVGPVPRNLHKHLGYFLLASRPADSSLGNFTLSVKFRDRVSFERLTITVEPRYNANRYNAIPLNTRNLCGPLDVVIRANVVKSHGYNAKDYNAIPIKTRKFLVPSQRETRLQREFSCSAALGYARGAATSLVSPSTFFLLSLSLGFMAALAHARGAATQLCSPSTFLLVSSRPLSLAVPRQ